MSNRRQVTKSRFEFEEDNKVAYLEVEIDDHGWITLVHTEVPPDLRGQGIAGTLLRTALEYARDNRLRIDVICPLAADYIKRHPELKLPVSERAAPSQE